MRKVNKNEKFELKLLIPCGHIFLSLFLSFFLYFFLSFILFLSLNVFEANVLFKIQVFKEDFLLRTYKRTLS